MRTDIRVSELSLWLKCHRRTYLQYEMGYDKDSMQMGVGRAFHTMLESYYTNNAVIIGADVDLTPEDMQMVHDMFSTYVVEVEEEGLDVGQETRAGEQRLDIEIGGLTLSGQIDALVYDEILDGIIVRDHKTVGQFFNTAQRDFQLMCYAVIARKHGWDVKAIEHNQVKRNKRTGRASPPFIRRVQWGVTERALENFERQLEQIIRDYYWDMKVAKETKTGVEHPVIWAKGTNECAWQCPFFEICGMIDDGEDYATVLETEFHRREEPVE